MDLRRQIREDMPELVKSLNLKRGLMGRLRGEIYTFRENEHNSQNFTIIVTNRRMRARNQGGYIVADINIRDGGLDGIIFPNKKIL